MLLLNRKKENFTMTRKPTLNLLKSLCYGPSVIWTWRSRLQLMYTADAHGWCTWLMHKADAHGWCTRRMHKADVHGWCTRLMNKADVHGWCTRLDKADSGRMTMVARGHRPFSLIWQHLGFNPKRKVLKKKKQKKGSGNDWELIKLY